MAHKPMIQAKVKITDKKERQKRLEHVLKLAANSYVEVGIVEPDDIYPGENVSVGQVAAWMEFGTHSAKGIEMVPSRSFLRTPIDQGAASINKVRIKALDSIIQEEASIEQGLSAIGAQIQKLMQNAITRGIPPPLSEARLREKRKNGYPDTPLIATRFLLEHIGFSVSLNL